MWSSRQLGVQAEIFVKDCSGRLRCHGSRVASVTIKNSREADAPYRDCCVTIFLNCVSLTPSVTVWSKNFSCNFRQPGRGHGGTSSTLDLKNIKSIGPYMLWVLVEQTQRQEAGPSRVGKDSSSVVPIFSTPVFPMNTVS